MTLWTPLGNIFYKDLACRQHIRSAVLSLGIVMGSASGAMAQQALPKLTTCDASFGEVVYVPAMSGVGTAEDALQPLSSTMVIHNVDPKTTISVKSVEIYDEMGAKIRTFLSDDVSLKPFASESFLSAISDDRLGVGANFLVEWASTRPACSPRVLSVMIGGTGVHGFSFSFQGTVIERTTAD